MQVVWFCLPHLFCSVLFVYLSLPVLFYVLLSFFNARFGVYFLLEGPGTLEALRRVLQLAFLTSSPHALIKINSFDVLLTNSKPRLPHFNR